MSLHGSFWADPQTEDFLRLDLIAGDIPPSLPITEATRLVHFAQAAVSETTQVLLPKTGEFHMTHFSGESDLNHLEFTGCRIFGAESQIRFDTPDAPETAPSFSTSFRIPANSPVQGRIRRLEHDSTPFENFVIRLEFTEVRIQDIRYRFYADITSIQPANGVELALTKSSYMRSETYTLPKLPGAATFFYRGGKLNLPQGFRTTWTTLTAP